MSIPMQKFLLMYSLYFFLLSRNYIVSIANQYKMNKQITTIDDYLSNQPYEVKNELQKIRDLITSLIPSITERIAYKICVFSLQKDVVGFAAYSSYCSFYIMSPPLVTEMNDELPGYSVSGATIHFTPKKPLPTLLITKIVKRRVDEILQS